MSPSDYPILGLLGIPLFTWMVGLAVLAVIGCLVFGIARWTLRAGKIAVILALFLLLLAAAVVGFVLLTVARGSMG